MGAGPSTSDVVALSTQIYRAVVSQLCFLLCLHGLVEAPRPAPVLLRLLLREKIIA